MDKLERSKVILDVLNRQEKATIKELSSLLKVSGVTVRKDLEALEQRRLVIRTQGNVRLFTDSLLIGERDYADKASRSIAEKKRIAKAAAALIEDGDTLFLDSSSTIDMMAPYLEVKRLEIITNNINLAYRLGPCRNITVVVPPGSVRDGSYSLLGSATARFLSGTFAGKAVLSCSAFHSKKGVLSTILDEAEISRIMLENSAQVIILADSSKYGLNAPYRICGFEEVDYMVTDTAFPAGEEASLQLKGRLVTA